MARLWTVRIAADNSIRVTPTHHSQVHLLVVDDEESVRRFASRVLEDAGYAVVDAPDGPAALKLSSDRNGFDLAVIDLMMPGMRGDELARQLRRSDPDLKVLYFTGFSDQLFSERPTLWNGEAFLDKPVTIEGLQQAVSLLLFGRTRGPESRRAMFRGSGRR